MLRHGNPLEELAPRPSFQEETARARHAEEALLAMLNACARVTETRSVIDWPEPESFGAWLSRLVFGQD